MTGRTFNGCRLECALWGIQAALGRGPVCWMPRMSEPPPPEEYLERLMEECSMSLFLCLCRKTQSHLWPEDVYPISKSLLAGAPPLSPGLPVCDLPAVREPRGRRGWRRGGRRGTRRPGSEPLRRSALLLAVLRPFGGEAAASCVAAPAESAGEHGGPQHGAAERRRRGGKEHAGLTRHTQFRLSKKLLTLRILPIPIIPRVSFLKLQVFLYLQSFVCKCPSQTPPSFVSSRSKLKNRCYPFF